MQQSFFKGCGGIRLSYIDFGGTGQAVILLHGVMSRGANWYDVSGWLKEHFHVYALDQRGHGRSDKPGSGYMREDFVADVMALLDELKIEQVILAGHSTGGLNAYVTAARYPDRVKAVVIEDMHAEPWPRKEIENWRQWFNSWPLPFICLKEAWDYFSSLRPAFAHHFIENLEETEDGYRPLFNPEHIIKILEGNNVKPWWDELKKIKCPVLMIHGERSDVVSKAEAERMAKTVEKGWFKEIEDAYHVVHDDQPGLYKAALLGFFKEIHMIN